MGPSVASQGVGLVEGGALPCCTVSVFRISWLIGRVGCLGASEGGQYHTFKGSVLCYSVTRLV